MCATIVYGFVFGLAAYILVTALAFSTLPAWQAVLVSLGFLAVELLLARYLVFRTLRRVTALVETALKIRDTVLENSGVDVHSVGRTNSGARMLGASPTLSTGPVEVELTVFPSDPNAEWSPRELVLVNTGDADQRFRPESVELVESGEAVPMPQTVTGARRLRLAVAVPAGVTRLALHYRGSDFGDVDLARSRP